MAITQTMQEGVYYNNLNNNAFYGKNVMHETGINVVKNPTEVGNAIQYEDKDSITWADFVNLTICGGSVIEGNVEMPDIKNVLVDMKTYWRDKQRYEKGHINRDKFITNSFRKDMRDDAYKYFTAVDLSYDENKNLLNASDIRNIFDGAEIDASHFAALKTVSIQQVLMAIENEEHFLSNLVTTINTNTLNDFKVLIWGDDQDKLVTRNIGLDGLPTGILPPKWTTRSIDNQLNGTIVSFNGNIGLTAWDVDVLSPFARILEGAITEDKEKWIADILNGSGFTSTAIGTDWDAFDTNNRPSAKAYVDMETMIQSIVDEHLGGDIGFATNRAVENIYNDNSSYVGNGVSIPPYDNRNAQIRKNRVTQLSRLQGYPVVIDSWINSDSIIGLEKKAIYFNQGPRRVSSITHPVLRTYGSIVLEFYKAKMMFPELIRRYTAVST